VKCIIAKKEPDHWEEHLRKHGKSTIFTNDLS